MTCDEAQKRAVSSIENLVLVAPQVSHLEDFWDETHLEVYKLGSHVSFQALLIVRSAVRENGDFML
jgi:hypothetical protein